MAGQVLGTHEGIVQTSGGYQREAGVFGIGCSGCHGCNVPISMGFRYPGQNAAVHPLNIERSIEKAAQYVGDA